MSRLEACIVCGSTTGHSCEFCAARLRLLEHVHEDRSPGPLAVFDQEHAAAVDRLRSAHTFVLAYVGDDGMGTVAANCREGYWLVAACALAAQAAGACLDETEAA